MTPIADMIEQMLADNAPAATIIAAVRGLERCLERLRTSPPLSAGLSADERRTKDRDRKRRDRALRGGDGPWMELVAKILRRDGYRCTYCGSNENLTADHMVPLSRGGTNADENLCACCHRCNAQKSNKTVEEWRSNGKQTMPAQSASVRNLSADKTDAPCDLTYLLSSIGEPLKKESKRDVVARARGSRMEAGAILTEPFRNAAIELGADPSEIQNAWAEFVDYWIGVPGNRGTKLDWLATWRNRVRDVLKRGKRNGHGNFNTKGRSASSDFFAGIASVAADITGNDQPSGPIAEDIPLGRVNIDG